MSRNFNVGDRVRYVRRSKNPLERDPQQPPVPLGTEGVVTVLDFDGTLHVDLQIKSTHPTGQWRCHAYQLEPIYDGNERVSWSECAWKPNSVNA